MMGTAPLEKPVVVRSLDTAGALNVQRLLTEAAHDDGFVGLSDQLLADLGDLAGPAPPDTIAALASRSDAELAGYAQAAHRDGEWTMQVVIHPADRDTNVSRDLMAAMVNAIARAGGGRVDWWVYAPTDRTDEVAAAHRLRFDRQLLQMRRPLPAEQQSSIATRGFQGVNDEDDWLAVNNRAFAGHHEQGGWTVDTLHQRMRQPWFDPDDIRLHERDGRLAGFCWTKTHSASLGEIYVIGVDPDFQGLGLGKQLTLAGLDHMTDRGRTEAMLYVAQENTAALAMYQHLGFAVHRVDRAYVGRVEPERG